MWSNVIPLRKGESARFKGKAEASKGRHLPTTWGKAVCRHKLKEDGSKLKGGEGLPRRDKSKVADKKKEADHILQTREPFGTRKCLCYTPLL